MDQVPIKHLMVPTGAQMLVEKTRMWIQSEQQDNVEERRKVVPTHKITFQGFISMSL